jgi:hypothetical protein
MDILLHTWFEKTTNCVMNFSTKQGRTGRCCKLLIFRSLYGIPTMLHQDFQGVISHAKCNCMVWY